MHIFKLLFITLLLPLFLLLFSSEVLAVDYDIEVSPQEVNSNTPAGSINENTEYVTVTFQGLSSGGPLYYCLQTDQDNCAGDFVEFTPTGNTFTIEVCPEDDGHLREGRCSADVGDVDYFEAQKTYKVGIYSAEDVDDWLKIANLKTIHFYPEVQILPSALTINTPLEINVIGLRIPFGNNARNDYSLQINGLNGTNEPDSAEFCDADRSTPNILKNIN